MLGMPQNTKECFVKSQYLALDSDDHRPTLGVVGMVFSEADKGWQGTDTPRMHALQEGSPGVKVLGISLTNDRDSCTGISADIRYERSFPRVFGTGRGMKVGILDYFFLPEGYMEPSSIGNGYGCKWFTSFLPAFFEHGGCVFFLPNDKSGMFLKMWDGHKDSTIAVALLPMDQCSQHPLYEATELITKTRAWAANVHPNLRCKNNELAVSTYLNRADPFLVVFKRSQFKSLQKALSYVRQICMGRTTKASYVTCGRSWTVESSFLTAFVALTKLHEGRPHTGEYMAIKEGDYKNFGCPFYWVIVRMVHKTIHKSLAAMVGKCGWQSLMPGCGSQETCIELYLQFPDCQQHEHSDWVSFTVEVLEYKLGKGASQFAVCACGKHFTPRVETDKDRLASPHRLNCATCNQ